LRQLHCKPSCFLQAHMFPASQCLDPPAIPGGDRLSLPSMCVMHHWHDATVALLRQLNITAIAKHLQPTFLQTVKFPASCSGFLQSQYLTSQSCQWCPDGCRASSECSSWQPSRANARECTLYAAFGAAATNVTPVLHVGGRGGLQAYMQSMLKVDRQ
jgi:hypothetical protein